MVVRAIEQEMKGQSASLLETASPIAGDEVNTPKCAAHYWIIEPANGPVSLGVCQVCREVSVWGSFAVQRDWHDAGSVRGRRDRPPQPYGASARPAPVRREQGRGWVRAVKRTPKFS